MSWSRPRRRHKNAVTDSLMQDAKRLHKTGRLGEAVSLYQRILQGNPRHTEALYGLGMAHAQSGRLQEGERLLGEALTFNPGFAEGWRARGMMLMHLGRREEARTSMDRALALKADFQEALAVRASLTAEPTEPRRIRIGACRRPRQRRPLERSRKRVGLHGTAG
jgi:Flp pilus assembly protein TadD